MSLYNPCVTSLPFVLFVTLTEYSSEEQEEEESDEGQEDGPFNENNMDFGKFMQM
jgi:hypothetical protein